MMIVCPNCATCYQVEPSSLGAAGRSVRCARCKKTWFAANSQAAAAIAQSHRQDVAAFAATTSVADYATPQPQATAEAFPVLEATPPTVPADIPAEPPAATADEAAPDDRGPAPLPEPAQELPPVDETPPAPLTAEAGKAPHAATASMPEDIESVAARRTRRQARRRSRASSGLVTAILALIAINAGVVAWRADVVRIMPQTASLFAAVGLPVNLRGIVFSDIVTRKETQDGVQLLVVEGIIKSTGRRVAEVPRLRFAVRNVAGQEIYSWTALPARNVLPPGATMPFKSRLASPPPEAHAVLVRFFNRRDLVAGIQ